MAAGLAAKLHRRLFDEKSGAVLLVAAFFVLELVLAQSLRYLEDEGIFTFEFARALAQAPLAVFFYVKAKPVLLLAYMLPAVFGFRAFLTVHALTGAAAVALVIAAAHHLGVKRPNVAGWLLATSFGFAVAASNGYPNCDGCFFLALSGYLYVADHRRAAAVVLGMLPFVRYELGAVTLVAVAVEVGWRHNWRFLIGVGAFGLVYGLAGALYHRDLLWLYREFPDPQGLPPELRLYRVPTVAEALGSLRDALLTNSPFFMALAVVGAASKRRPAFIVFAAAFAIYFALTAFELAGLLGFDRSPRYYVTALPLLAWLLPYALEPDPPSVAWTGAVLLACVVALSGPLAIRDGGWAFAVAMAAIASVRILADRQRAAEGLLLTAAIVTFAIELAGDHGVERGQHEGTHALVTAMREAGIYRSQPLFTDVPAARYDSCAGLGETVLLVNQTTDWEMRRFMSPSQFEVVRAALSLQQELFEPGSHQVRHDAVYALRDDARTKGWRDRVEADAPERVAMGRFWVYHWPSP